MIKKIRILLRNRFMLKDEEKDLPQPHTYEAPRKEFVITGSKVRCEGFVSINGEPLIDAEFDFSRCPQPLHPICLRALCPQEISVGDDILNEIWGEWIRGKHEENPP